tara:strand:- start:14 stop:967 length:954 start_codon:yes stop_codon:yes gene_type:complete
MAILRYPLEALTGTTDYLQIDIKEYKRDSSKLIQKKGFGRNTLNTRAGNTRSGSLSTKSVKNTGTILLQIPSDIKDGNSASYGDSKMNTLTGAAAGALSGGMRAGAELAKALTNEQTFSEAGDKIKKDIGGNLSPGETEALLSAAQKGITAKATSAAMGVFGANVSTEDLLARQSGQIFNPNLELLFNGPTLRSFSFSFKFTPRSPSESNQCKQIIRSFKQNMAPKTGGDTVGGSSIFLKTPNLFELRYRKGNNNHPFLNQFKQCFLTNMSVNYTGEGVYATYDDATPISMQLNLTFKEIEPIYFDDYDKDSSGVGF